MNYNYLQQGGLTSIPARPVFRGQQHQLGYLTPNQSELLRRQGGGVTPSGGQYKGPGGLNTFFRYFMTPELKEKKRQHEESRLPAWNKMLPQERLSFLEESLNSSEIKETDLSEMPESFMNWNQSEDNPSYRWLQYTNNPTRQPPLSKLDEYIAPSISPVTPRGFTSPSFPSVGRDPFSIEPSPTSLPSTPSVGRDPFSIEPSPTSLPSTPSVGRDPFSTEPPTISHDPMMPIERLPSGYPTPATTPIPPTSTPTVATNPLFPITPPAAPAAEPVTPEAPLTLGSGTVLGSPESAGQFNFQGKSFHIHPAQHGGGIQSLPIRPVLSGQQHELSYITPEEAQLLRQYGGGVTPDGGQYRGPGGISAYVDAGSGTGHGGPAAGPGSEGGSTAAGGVGDPSGPGPGQSGVVGQSVFGMTPGHYAPYGGVHGDVPGTESFGEGAFSVDKGNKAALAVVLSLDDRKHINPESLAAILGDPKGFLSGSVGSDGEAFTGSMHDKVRSALDAGLVDISTHGDMDSTFGHVTAITPGQAATGIAVPAQDRTNVGVVGSMMSKAVHGLTDILGLVAPPIATFSKVMGLAQMLGLAKDQDTFGDLGLMGLFGDIIGDITVGDDGETIGDALSDVFDPITSLTDEFGNIVGDAVNTVYEGITGLADESGLSSLYSSIDLGSFDGGTSTDPGKGGGPGVQVYYPTTPDLIELAKENKEEEEEKKEEEEELARLLNERTMEEIRNRYVGNLDDESEILDELTLEEIRNRYVGNLDDEPEITELAGGGYLPRLPEKVTYHSGAGGEEAGGGTSGTTFVRPWDKWNFINAMDLPQSVSTYGAVPKGANFGRPVYRDKMFNEALKKHTEILNEKYDFSPEEKHLKVWSPSDSYQDDPFYVSPTFQTYPNKKEDKDKEEKLARLLVEQQLAPNEVITVQGGGGIQDLINKQHEEYSVGNQNNIPSFNKATPHPDLMNGSDGYISNILKGHTVPMGMTNVQQMQKPIEAFPTGGQMNTTNTQYADYSKPQSFYAMPNMNRVT